MTVTSKKTKNQRSLRKAYRKAGKCICGRKRWEPYKQCKSCVLKGRARSAKYQARIRPACEALRICNVCFIREAIPGVKYCGVCAEYHSTYQTRKRHGEIKGHPRRQDDEVL